MTVARQGRRARSRSGVKLRFLDDFNRSNRSLDGDNGWSKSTSLSSLNIISNECGGSGGIGVYQNNRADSAVAGVTSFDFNFKNILPDFYIIARALDPNAGTPKQYQLGVVGGLSQLRIFEINGVTFNSVRNIPITLAAGDLGRLKVTDDGSNLTVELENITQSLIFSTSFPTTLYNTITTKGIKLVENSTRITVDNFKIESL